VPLEANRERERKRKLAPAAGDAAPVQQRRASFSRLKAHSRGRASFSRLKEARPLLWG